MQQLAEPVRAFLATEVAGAGLLVAATVLALVWANSPLDGAYASLWSTEIAVQIGDAELREDLRHWVNDGLMVFFFLVVGLEVRREFAMGELVDRSRLTVPALGAVAGVVVPALIYLALNPSGEAARGWGVVMATDTAFVLGALALIGPACPTQLRLFLLTLAVVDDIVALSVVAVFYSDDVNAAALLVSAGCAGLILLLGRLRVWRGPAYFLVGAVLWVAMVESGVHPTIAGVVIGLCITAYPSRREEVEQAGRLARRFRQSPSPALGRSTQLMVQRAVSPNERLQELLHPWTSFVVVPIFAVANAGVPLDLGTLGRAAGSPVTLGILAGLVGGKLLGVGLASTLAVRTGAGLLPRGVGRGQLWGGAALAGIGFTVSLFVVDLAFDSAALAQEAKVGVLGASIAAAALGAAIFRVAGRRGEGATEALPSVLDPPVDEGRDHVRGPADAPLTLVEYGDFECPFCGRATGVVDELLERFADELRYVFRHLPLADVHPRAQLAAEAAEAAHAQGAFWPMHDRLFASQDALAAEDLVDHAAALGLDVERFTDDLRERRFAGRVRDDAIGAEASGAQSTPTFFVGATRHRGAGDAETLGRAVEAERERRMAAAG